MQYGEINVRILADEPLTLKVNLARFMIEWKILLKITNPIV